ncbi:MAG TPA: cell division protein FtsZ [Allosphingosinicella sp.]|jgi:cell division protein FtsZ|nr:cell division protein FtsZ [Allosphingosinicella sp.]
MIELASGIEELHPRITVIGVGGAGGNAVANMMLNGVKGVTFVVANTDAQALAASPVDRILQLGRMTTEGLGAGSRAEIGKAAAEESLAEIEDMLEGAHMCFVAAGMGGGTGSGAAPVIAEAARAKGILTVGVATKPFAFEGRRRAAVAEAGLEELEKHVDTLIVIPNQNLFRVSSPATTFKAAFDLADDVLQQGVRGITDLMVQPGLINLDFADVRTIMAYPGKAMMGTGEACGDDRALRAAEQAIANPLLDEALKGASGLIISITGGEDMLLMEIDEIASHIKALVDPDADIIWGSAFEPALAGRIRVSVVATGIDAAQGVAADTPVLQTAAPVRPIAAPVLSTIPVQAPIFAPVFKAPEQVALPLPAPEAETDDELLLTVERQLVLVAPPGAGEIAMVDPFSLEAPAAAEIVPAHSPSLFERMAMLARGAVQEARDTKDGPPMPMLYRGRDYASQQRIARAA